MALSCLEGELLLAHRLRVELGKRIRCAAEGGMHGPIDLIETRRFGFPLLHHGIKNPRKA